MNREAQTFYALDWGDAAQCPQTIDESVALIQAFALQEFEQAAKRDQLYYHNRSHIQTVKRRSHLIMRLLDSVGASDARMALLLDLAVAAHDMVQIFIPRSQPHMTRKREPGVSERATIAKLLDYIQAFNSQVPSSARLTEADIAIVQEAIAATACAYDTTEQAIYQPMLANPEIGITTRILAIADINAAAMDGIAQYSREGALLFLEENIDVVPLLLNGKIYDVEPSLHENIRQRLLTRCRFQVSFAKSRLHRLPQELVGLPEAAIPLLMREVFLHLDSETVDAIVAETPTQEDASLSELLQFFQFERYLVEG